MKKGDDIEIMNKRLDVESKIFFFEYRQNPNGKFLRIIEKSSGKKNAIIIPDSGVAEFINVLSSIRDKR